MLNKFKILKPLCYFYRLYATSFFKKGDISIYLKDEYRYNDLIESLQRSWQTYLNESVSFIIKDKNDRMIGLCLNKRFHFDPTEDCSHPRPLSLTANVNAFAHYLYSQILWVPFFSIFIDYQRKLQLNFVYLFRQI